MIVGVTDTTTSTIEWAMAELVLQPDVIRQAQKELDTVVGTDRLVQESDVPNLPYLQAITKEVFRMHPVVPLSVPHVSSRACEVLGFKIASRTELIFNVFAIHRDPSVYEDPDTFNVNRFMDDRHRNVDATATFSSYELMPFGAGRRMCPAYALGYQLVSVVVAHFLHSFNWTLPEGNHTAQVVDMNEKFGIVVSMKTPMSLVVKPRSLAFLYT
jgi:flavonoid 3'-monooxygenase